MRQETIGKIIKMCHNVTNAPKDKLFLELRPEVKATVIQKQCVTPPTPRCINRLNLGFLPQIIKEIWSGHGFSRTEARDHPKQYATIWDPKVYPHTNFGIPTLNNIGEMLRPRFF